jgi:hypothetical protein
MQYLSYTAMLVFFFNFSLHAALPPLSEEARTAEASDIVKGRVLSLEETAYGSRDKRNYLHNVRMEVISVQKGGILPGQVITFYYWMAAKRLGNVTGDMGQIENRKIGHVIRADKTIQVYMRMDENKKNQLINPNGFEVIEELAEDYVILF